MAQYYHSSSKPTKFFIKFSFPSMATIPLFYAVLLLSPITFSAANDFPTTSLYLSPKTLFSNYNKMLTTFKIFIYAPPPSTPTTPLFTTPQNSQFYTSLLNSPFVTQDPTQAHLFFIPFPSTTSTRNLARVIRNIRITFPFWNRTLGADHFYLSISGVDLSSDRNIVELKKNAILISNFPTNSGLFIPHKDITLPAVHNFEITTPSVNDTMSFTGYMKLKVSERIPLRLIEEIIDDSEFKVEFENDLKFVKNSRFCLFVYGSDTTWMIEAMASRCVPVVITDRPIQDLPLMDVINWSEIAVFVGGNGGVDGLKRLLAGISENRYEKMVESGVAATRHLVWNAEPQTQDVFHMVVYQLWLRRHTVRYARWVEQ